MKIFVKIFYALVFLVLGFVLYLEYNNYKISNQRIDMSVYANEIATLKNNIEIIKKYDNVGNPKLSQTIDRCLKDIKYIDILNESTIGAKELYAVAGKGISSSCNDMDYRDDSNIKKNIWKNSI